MGGDDIIFGNTGVDIILAGEDNDIVNGGSEDDFIFGESGSDRLEGFTGDDSVDGGSGDDLVDGFDGNDPVRGDAGNDLLRGGSGQDAFGFRAPELANGITERDVIADYSGANDENDVLDLPNGENDVQLSTLIGDGLLVILEGDRDEVVFLGVTSQDDILFA